MFPDHDLTSRKDFIKETVRKVSCSRDQRRLGYHGSATEYYLPPVCCEFSSVSLLDLCWYVSESQHPANFSG